MHAAPVYRALLLLSLGTPGVAAETSSVEPHPLWSCAVNHYILEGRSSDALRTTTNVMAAVRVAGRAESRAFADLLHTHGIVLYKLLGDAAAADAAFAEADALCVRLYGADARQRIELLNRRCEASVKDGRFKAGAEFGRIAVRIATNTHGPQHRTTLRAMHYLALALAELPECDQETDSVLRLVLDSWIKVDGPEGYWTGLAWNNLGLFLIQTGRFAQGRDAIFRGEQIVMKQIEPHTPDAMATTRNLIRVAMEGGDRREAMRLAEREFALQVELFRKSFGTLGESRRLTMKSQFEPGRWLCALGDPSPIARAILQTKAITLDYLMTPAAGEPDSRVFDILLLPSRGELGMRVCPHDKLSAPRPENASRRRAQPPETTAPEEIARLTSLYAVTAPQVCAALPTSTAVVELTRYKHYLGGFKDEVRYGALVFLPTSGRSADRLQWIPLGPAAAIDREVNGLGESVADTLSAATMSTRLRALHSLVWEPIAKALPAGTENVFVAPDGDLCFLPFSALIAPDGAFVADQYLIMYLSTARDLFRVDPADGITTDDFIIFAAPAFGQPVAATTAEEARGRFRDADGRSLAKLELTDLPGARREAELLSSLATTRGIPLRVFTGTEATKSNVERQKSPRIVHFATHGFLLPPSTKSEFTDPMDRSGLALTGAQATVRALADSKPLPESAADGLLTARQVAQLKWKDTWLVSLSACDTGRGEARDGESVLGLRRGFLAAGVKNLLLSLWKISDDETAGFMQDFYLRALTTGDAATALALTQREWLRRVRAERGVAAAVSIAGGFVLNCSGRIPLRTSPPAAP